MRPVNARTVNAKGTSIAACPFAFMIDPVGLVSAAAVATATSATTTVSAATAAAATAAATAGLTWTSFVDFDVATTDRRAV